MISEEIRKSQYKLEAYIVDSIAEFEKDTGLEIETLYLVRTIHEHNCGYLKDDNIAITYSKLKSNAFNS